MGKKPVVALVGLIWAGMFVAGCGECCRSCTRKGQNSTPPMMSKGPKSFDGPPTGLVGDKDLVPPPKPGDSSSLIVPASAPGKQMSANVQADGTAPLSQQALTPRKHSGFANGGDSRLHSDSVIGRSGGELGSKMPMPNPPVTARASETPAAPGKFNEPVGSGGTTLPDIGGTPALPAARSSIATTTPPAPVNDSSLVPPPPPPSQPISAVPPPPPGR